MGWIMLAKPGDDYGPCVGSCDHKDCAATRTEASTPCIYCGNPIGYENKFYINTFYGDDGRMTGRTYACFVCTHVEAEKRRKAMQD